MATSARRGPCCTLVHVYTLFPSGVPFVTLVAQTLMATCKVLASTVLTEAASDLGAFVDVVPAVGEAGTVGAQLLVFQAARAWARAAWRAPTKDVGKLDSTTATG